MSDKRKTRKSRQTLKNYFSSGALPEERHFHELIDSTLNMEDEGFNKTPEDGLQVVTRSGESGSGQSLISFFRERQEAKGPLWRLRFDRGFDALQFVAPSEGGDGGEKPEGGAAAGTPRQPLLSLAPEGKLGVNVARPDADLDVGGLARSRGRSGVVPAGVVADDVRADGEWHAITGELKGCQALEVVAGVGGTPGQGHYALMHAIALNAHQPKGWFLNLFGRKNRIRAHQSYYRSRADKLELRWTGDRKGYRLEVKTRRRYPSEGGRPPRILFHVTSLWAHPFMEAPRRQEGGEAEGSRDEAVAAPGKTAPESGSEAT